MNHSIFWDIDALFQTVCKQKQYICSIGLWILPVFKILMRRSKLRDNIIEVTGVIPFFVPSGKGNEI